MADINKQIDERIRSFLTELNDLVRMAAIQAVSDALGAPKAARPAPAKAAGRAPAKAAGPAPAKAAGPAPAKAAGPAPAPAARRQGQRKKGEKRPQAELARVRGLLEQYIKAHPGQGIERIGKSLALPTNELTRPLNKLLATGTVRKEGDRRATKYFPPDGSQPAGGNKPRPRSASKPRPAAKKKAARKK